MDHELSKKATNKIESLCESGCTAVSHILEKARQGNVIEELAEFSTADKKQVLDELEKIMAVYEPKDEK